MCILCSGSPVDGDIRGQNSNEFMVGMMSAPCTSPCCCLASCFCPCCAQYIIRRKALDNDMSKYVCFQGYLDGVIPCLRSGQCGERSCPHCCLCLESWLCNGCAVSATRMLVMDRYNLRPDKWDNRIIRCNNCIQLLSCVCSCLAICISELGNCADLLNCFAQCTYMTTQGCMTAQVNVELKRRKNYRAAVDEVMDRV
ncbi:hypothetical protein ABG067_005835 [Albugo candida]